MGTRAEHFFKWPHARSLALASIVFALFLLVAALPRFSYSQNSAPNDANVNSTDAQNQSGVRIIEANGRNATEPSAPTRLILETAPAIQQEPSPVSSAPQQSSGNPEQNTPRDQFAPPANVPAQPFAANPPQAPVNQKFPTTLPNNFSALQQPTAQGWNVQLRLAWGGGAEQTWRGEIRWSDGPVTFVRALGVEADEPGSMRTKGGTLIFAQRSMRTYDGVDIVVPYKPDGKLSYRFQSADGQPITGEATLDEIMQKSWQKSLDERGNRLFVRRLPEDHLRVKTEKSSLVFAPQEKLKFEVTPHLLQTADGNGIKVKARLVAKSNEQEQWTNEFSIASWATTWSKPAQDGGAQPSIPFECSLPTTEGVYNLIIEAIEQRGFRWGKTIATRQVQLVVIGDRPQVAPSDANPTWNKLHEIDPMSSSWEKFRSNLTTWPGTKTGSFNNGLSNIVTLPELGKVIQLGIDPKSNLNPKQPVDPKAPAQKPNGDVAWEAYHLPISQPGMPHIVEVEYPSNIATKLGVSLVEPNAAGVVQPIGLDSGVVIPREATSEPGTWSRHRLVVWPRTKSPVLLLTNRNENGPAYYGKIRVLAGPAHLTGNGQLRNSLENQRLYVANWQRPFFPENFSASEQIDQWSGRTLDDWQTFYEGASRAIEYAHHANFNGLAIPVLSDGSTLYPSNCLQPTPRYDTGIFFDNGNDPERKDVLEMLLRMTDRDGLRTFATMQFTSLLPELEEISQNEQSDGIYLVGEHGMPWHKLYPPRRGLAPYYNPLDPRVQNAIVRCVREVIDRAGKHRSFAGINLELSSEGYLQFPGELWGIDDRTIAQFELEAQIKLPGDGQQRYAQRAAVIRENQTIRQQWLEWRATKLRQFYELIRREVARSSAGARLVLSPTNAFDSPDLVSDQLPSLTARRNSSELRSKLGWGSGQQSILAEIPWLRTWHISLAESAVAQATHLERNADRTWERWSQGSATDGALFLHEPQRLRLPTFDAKSPFGADKTFTWQITQFSSSGAANRQRFTSAISQMDCDWIFDGGWLMPMGQEESLGELIAAYRRLPIARFETIPSETEPVVLRRLVRDGQTWFYAVNHSPYPVTMSLDVDGPPGTKPTELTGMRTVAPMVGNRWNVELKPFDLFAVNFAGDVQLKSTGVKYPARVAQELAADLAEIRQRRASLENPQPSVPLLNGDFEQRDKSNSLVGWELFASAPQNGQIQYDERSPKQGKQSLRIASLDTNGVTLQSAPFDAPKTGRLAVAIYLRVEKPEQQPNIRLSVSGYWHDREYYRFAPVGKFQPASPLQADWKQYVLPINDLPAEGLSQLRLRVDIIGQGEVFIDQVQMYDLVYSETERRQLDKQLITVEQELKHEKLGRAWIDLNGYWPRYLRENVPVLVPPNTNIANDPQAAPGADKVPPKQATKPTIKERVREWWRF